MNNFKITVWLIIAIEITLVDDAFLLSPDHEKTRTKISVTIYSTLHENGTVSIRLTDANNTPIT